MTEDHTKKLLKRLLETTRESDPDGGGSATRQEPGPPATPEQIAALERHWGHRLPPLYREVLETYNGRFRLWFDVRLLSTQDILDEADELRTFEESPHWGWIFACGTESHDALAFDPSPVGDNGEMAVVHVSDDGAGKRWPSIGALMNEIGTWLLFGFGESGEHLYNLWTNLWVCWPHVRSPHSRAFVPGHDQGVHPGQRSLFAQVRGGTSTPLLVDGEQAQVDLRFEQAIKTVEPTKGTLAIVLTDAPSEETAFFYYVRYEPCAYLVIALNPIAKRATLCASSTTWNALGPRFMSTTEKVEQLLAQGRITDALLLSIDEACESLKLVKENWR